MAASSRDAYHYLVNIDEYPEALSLAHEVIRDELTGIDDLWARLAAHRCTQRLFGPVGAAREPVIFPS